uniref:SDR family oxidoreductase n=1 Tax=Streptomyces parvulus TaxID=146923 RepID=UPI003F5799E7
MTRAWAAECGPAGVRVNAVARGPYYASAPSEYLDKYIPHIPLRRAARPKDVSKVIVFLAGADGSYVGPCPRMLDTYDTGCWGSKNGNSRQELPHLRSEQKGMFTSYDALNGNAEVSTHDGEPFPPCIRRTGRSPR